MINYEILMELHVSFYNLNYKHHVRHCEFYLQNNYERIFERHYVVRLLISLAQSYINQIQHLPLNLLINPKTCFI